MIRHDAFTFNGIYSGNYGVWVNGGGTFGAAARRYSKVIVPGRNGALTIDDGAFDEIEHPYECFIIDSYTANIRDLRNALMAVNGYARLVDSINTGEFYRARYMDGLEVDTLENANGGKFKLRFMRDPRRFLTSGETAVTFTANGTITNPTLFESRPSIRVYGTGTLTVSGVACQINYNPGYIDIDSEMQDCFYGTTNCNDYVTFSGDDFPTLQPGSNGITLSGITRALVTPNWCRL